MYTIEKNYKFTSTLPNRKGTTRIILHHAEASSCTPDQIHSWHLNKGWAGIGYHFLVRKDGSVHRGRPENKQGSHAGGNNSDSIGICAEGAYMTETMPDAQKQALKELVAHLKAKYGISKVQKHSEVKATSCPGKNYPFGEIAGVAASVGNVTNSAPTTVAVEATYPTLKSGFNSDAVKTLQTKLNALRFDCGKVDGVFGAKTLAAVKAFQAANGLSVDGICGPKTWDKLYGGTAAKTTTTKKVGKCTGNNVNVRKGPGKNYGSIRTLNAGNLFDILAVEGEWTKVNVAGTIGYISSKYVG